MGDNPLIYPYLIKLIIDGKSKHQIKTDLIKEGPEVDWAYYRKDENVDKVL